jgi:hypothetical protein
MLSKLYDPLWTFLLILSSNRHDLGRLTLRTRHGVDEPVSPTDHPVGWAPGATSQLPGS